MSYHGTDRAKIILGLPDMHWPYHDETACAVALRVAEYLRPDLTFFYGDALDCEMFSSHPSRTFNRDLAASWLDDHVRPFLDYYADIEAASLETKFIEGNHENWVEGYFIKRLGDQIGSDVFRTYSPYHFISRERSKPFTWIPYNPEDFVSSLQLAPNLIAVHGWSHSKNAAEAHLTKARTVSITYGHTHRQQYEAIRDPMFDQHLRAWSPGCLCQFQQKYNHRTGPTTWTHGLTLIFQSRRDVDDWESYTVVIDGGRAILPCGKEIRA